MSRADLLLQLVQSGTTGDKTLFKKVVEAIISEERAKNHNVLADKLQDNLNFYELDKKSLSYSNGIKAENKIENLIYETTPQLSFRDLVLNEEVSNVIQDIVEEHNRVDLLRSFNLEPRNRLLLIGPPGNGKTSIAEALSNELGTSFYTIRYEGIIGSYLGETSSRLKALFEFIRTQRCVLFFDEFDSIGKERGDTHETGEIKRVVSSLLLQIDRLPSYVVIVAATNHPELLDRAVWRRFQVKAAIEKPNKFQVSQYISRFEQKFNIKFGAIGTEIENKLLGLSYSEIQDFLTDVIRRYVLDYPNSINSLKAIVRDKLSALKSSYKP